MKNRNVFCGFIAIVLAGTIGCATVGETGDRPLTDADGKVQFVLKDCSKFEGERVDDCNTINQLRSKLAKRMNDAAKAKAQVAKRDDPQPPEQSDGEQDDDVPSGYGLGTTPRDMMSTIGPAEIIASTELTHDAVGTGIKITRLQDVVPDNSATVVCVGANRYIGAFVPTHLDRTRSGNVSRITSRCAPIWSNFVEVNADVVSLDFFVPNGQMAKDRTRVYIHKKTLQYMRQPTDSRYIEVQASGGDVVSIN